MPVKFLDWIYDTDDNMSCKILSVWFLWILIGISFSDERRGQGEYLIDISGLRTLLFPSNWVGYIIAIFARKIWNVKMKDFP